MSFVLNGRSAPTMPLEDALAFADACDITSDEELGAFADVDIRDAFASSVTKDGLFVDAMALADPAADGAYSPMFLSADAFFGSDMSMQELHTVGLGQITGVQARANAAGTGNRRSSELNAAATGSAAKRSRAKSAIGAAHAREARRDSQSSGPRRQRASSSASKATPTSASTAKVVPVTSDSGANPPAKKRIRRQREELLYLREKVKVLERSLSSLRLDKSSDGDSSSTTESSDSADSSSIAENEEDEEHSARVISEFEHRYKVEASSDASEGQASLWEGVASRQYVERERAEHENRHLKDALQKQIHLAKSLEQILQHQPTADLLATPADFEAFQLITQGDEHSDREAVFDQLISEVSRAFDNFHLEVNSATLAAMKRDIEDIKVESCLQKGLAVRFSAHKEIPFSRQSVSNGMWKFIGLGGPRMEAYYYREHDKTSENRIAHSFGSKIKTGYATLDFRWRHVVERRSEPGRDVFVWRGVVKPVKFSGAPIHGIRFYERGWMVIEEGESADGSLLTSMTSSCSLSPLVDEPGSHHDVAIGALTDFVVESFHANAMRCRETVIGFVAQEESDSVISL